MRAFRLACIAGILFASNQVLAQSAGTWSGKIGYNEFRPKVDSGDITGVPNGKIDVGNGGSVFGSATYMLTDQTSVELAFGVPPKLDIVGRGTIEKAGKIADTKVWSPILMFQYRLGSPDSLFRPYIGIGGTYTKYTSVTTTPMLSMLTNPGGTTTASIDSAWGLVGQLGATYKLNDRWYLDGSLVPMRLKTTAHLSTGQSVDVSVNPLLINLAVGYHF